MGRKKKDEELVLAEGTVQSLERVKAFRDIPDEYNEEMFNKFSKTLVRFLDYAEKEEELPDELVKEEKELFKWFRHGAKAGYLRNGTSKMSKLTSVDVFYILTSNIPAETIAKKFGIEKHMVKMIRRGEAISWAWEYSLVRKIMSIVRNRSKNRNRTRDRYAYLLYKVDRKTKERELLHASLGVTTLRATRRRIIPTRDLERFTKSNTLDIWYPIETVLISS